MTNIVQATGDPSIYSCNNYCVPLTPAYIPPTYPTYINYPIYQNNYSELNLMTMVIQNMQKQLDEMQKTLKEMQDRLNKE